MAAPSGRSLSSRLRYRCCFLMLTSAVLRSESLHRAEVLDFFTPVPPTKHNDVHPMTIQLHQVAIGKTTYGSMEYGRAGRHIDPRRCAAGGTGLYMECREGICREFTSMTKEQWLDNSHWFDTNVHSDTKVEMKSDTYGDALKERLQTLGLPMNKVLHLGRNISIAWKSMWRR